ncbi:MAG: hypothetical protein J6126_01470, partial [Clostridia bacterium]|nr:hypothetical protein [Clostridia bacterium]
VGVFDDSFSYNIMYFLLNPITTFCMVTRWHSRGRRFDPDYLHQEKAFLSERQKRFFSYIRLSPSYFALRVSSGEYNIILRQRRNTSLVCEAKISLARNGKRHGNRGAAPSLFN